MGYCDSEQRTEKNKGCIIEKESTLIIYMCVCFPRSYSVYGFHAKKKKKTLKIYCESKIVKPEKIDKN